jgi:DNA-binding response OmpR family regulator
MKARILWIEGKQAESPSFIPALRKKGFTIEVVSTGAQAEEILALLDPDLIILNVASMRSSGRRICQNLRLRRERLPILVIASPEKPFEGESCATIVLTLPFTSRKLVNRILPMLSHETDSVMHVGAIRLDLEHRRVRCQGRESRLTPRLAHLLQTMMASPGVVLDREDLFSEVWRTEYTADTRTLDVHISWLRRAIEEDPQNPQFLKTIRGVGYRLDL